MYIVREDRSGHIGTELANHRRPPYKVVAFQSATMNIGIITYRKYDENVLLNSSFQTEELFDIILNDSDFVRFDIVDGHGNVLLSTRYDEERKETLHIKAVKVLREEEILGRDYNAFRTPSMIFKTKVRWNADGARFRTKKKAVEYADEKNRRAKMKIEQFVDRITI